MCVTSHTSDSLAQLSRHKRMPQLSHPHESVDYNLGLFSFPYFYRLICGLFKAEIFQIVRIFFFVSEYCISKSYLTHRCWGGEMEPYLSQVYLCANEYKESKLSSSICYSKPLSITPPTYHLQPRNCVRR